MEREIETKAQTFCYRNKTKTFWFGPLIIGTKAERFNLFQNYLKSNRNVLAFFKVQKRNQNKTELISYQIETLNFCELFPNFFASSERFCLLQASQESKQNFCIFKKWYQNETKTLQVAPGFSKDKTKLFCCSNKILETDQNKSFWTKFF